jgi:hypothetical protein
MDKNPNYTADDVMSFPWMSIDQKAAGAQEPSDFSKRTYDAIREERRSFPHTFLSVDLWCRLDISVID